MHRLRATDVVLGREVLGAVVEEDAGTGDDDAGPERRRKALVQADRHAVLVARAEVDGVTVAAVAVLERADEALVPFGAVRRQAVQRLEAFQRTEREVAAAVRWHLGDFEAAPLGRDWIDPLGLVCAEVFGIERGWGERAHLLVEVIKVLQSVREVVLHQWIVSQEDAGCFGVAFEQGPHQFGDPGEAGSARDAFAGVADGWLQKVV